MDRLAEIRERAEAATPGPWSAHNVDDDHCMTALFVGTEQVDEADLTDDHDCVDQVVSITLLQAPRMAIVADGRWQENTAFIAHSRSDVPWLISEVERLRRVEQASIAYLVASDRYLAAANSDTIDGGWQRALEAQYDARNTLDAALAKPSPAT